MCLYPRLIRNPRYKGKQELCTDERKLYVPIGCGNCYECRRQKAQQWRVRLQEELKERKYAYFVTLTFSNEELKKLMKETKNIECNAICGKATRRMLERYRKKNHISLRHWLITELGHEGTERIHMHGIIFPDEPMTNEELSNYWKYGRTDTGKYCNGQSINYIVKYVCKIDKDHKGYMPQIFCSAGLGKSFITTTAAKRTYKYEKGKTPEWYMLPNGQKVALPLYMRNYLYTEEERDQMWTDKLDKGEIYVNGIKMPVRTIEQQMQYEKVLKEQQRWNEEIGYGTPYEEWQAKKYNVTLKMLNKTANNRKKLSFLNN